MSGQKMPVHQHPAAIPPNAYSGSRAPAPLRTAPDGAGKRAQAHARLPRRLPRLEDNNLVHLKVIRGGHLIYCNYLYAIRLSGDAPN